ncbi:MAG: hypothetical protein OEZ06_04075 [Myxococcales bacterium]|nr:hypothetical protein [Myxococcales bacterium]
MRLSSCPRSQALSALAALALVTASCGGSPESEPAAAAPETEGGEQVAAAEPAPPDESAETQQAADEGAMDEVVELSMKLGANRAALAKQLEKPRPDCQRSQELRDSICESAASICTISEREQDAVGHCDRSSSKCEKAKQDVAGLRCG